MSNVTNIDDAAILSDEDFLNELGNPSFLASEEDNSDALGEQDEPEQAEGEGQEAEQGVEASEQEEQEALEEDEQLEEQDSEQEGEEQEESEAKEPEEDEEAVNEADQFFKAVTQPFKANGREMSVKTPEEAIKLMQMGANYAKRMSELKPNMQVIKTLDNAKLLDHDKINYMVDLMNGDQKAIMKLLHETKFDIDTVEDLESQSQDYQASNKIVPTQAIELDEVIANNQGDEDFTRVMTDVRSWDDSALNKMAEEPQVLNHLTQHQKKGIYSKVVNELTRLRTLNDASVTGLDDLDAYIKVGDMLDKQGAFADQATPAVKPDANAQAVKDAVQNAIDKRKPKKPAANKKAAANVKATPAKRPIKAPSMEDLAALDDEAFMKQLNL